mmetsp:Transcript_18314/g.57613  ORF Transcript_18314/g.57613 Transcript_18314/m.57613 type:complete len:367 (-) Transcript_18314:22-1122(-)
MNEGQRRCPAGSRSVSKKPSPRLKRAFVAAPGRALAAPVRRRPRVEWLSVRRMEEGLVKSSHAIYITGLPTTVGQIQLEDICKGVGKIKKIKVYRDAGGIPKGDATVVFEPRKGREVAVEAVDELDGKRIDQGGLGSYVISVQEAMFKPSAAAPRRSEPEAVEERRSFAPPDAPKALLKNLVDPKNDLGDREARALEDEVGMECMKHGRVLEAEFLRDDAAVLVTFASLDAARMCATAMHGRYFDERVIRAELWPDGKRQSSVQARAAPRQKQPQQQRATDYVGAPPPRTAEPPPKKAAVDPDQPTARVRKEAESPAPAAPPKPLMAFVRATDQPPPPPPPTQPNPKPPAADKSAKKRTAADFFDD